MSTRNVLQFNLGMLKQQIARISDDQMCDQPAGLVNHPAWSLGHLAVSADFLCKILGGQGVCPADWEAKFNIGSTPTAEASAYPDKDTLLGTLEKACFNAMEAYEKADASLLAASPEPESLRKMFATNGDVAEMLFSSHMGMHIGQISAWSRAMGLAPLF